MGLSVRLRGTRGRSGGKASCDCSLKCFAHHLHPTESGVCESPLVPISCPLPLRGGCLMLYQSLAGHEELFLFVSVQVIVLCISKASLSSTTLSTSHFTGMGSAHSYPLIPVLLPQPKPSQVARCQPFVGLQQLYLDSKRGTQMRKGRGWKTPPSVQTCPAERFCSQATEPVKGAVSWALPTRSLRAELFPVC